VPSGLEQEPVRVSENPAPYSRHVRSFAPRRKHAR
jgi:hypothetical protein